MNFDFSDEQILFRENLVKFLKNEITRDLVEKVEDEDKIPDDFWNKFKGLGWLGLTVPEAYGGSGCDAVYQALAIEILGKYLAPLSLSYITMSSYGIRPVSLLGDEEQKAFFLPKIGSGDVKVTLAFDEPYSYRNYPSMTTSALLDGDSYVLNGTKTFVCAGDIVDYVIVVVKTESNSGPSEPTLLIVDVNLSGIHRRSIKKLGLKGSGMAEISFSNVKIHKRNLLGEAQKDTDYISRIIDNEDMSFAAMSLGVAKAAFEMAVQYAKERYAFNKPIGEFQAIQHYLADMKTHIEVADSMVYKAAWLQSRGEYSGTQAPAAKLFASRTALDVANRGMRIMGGWGLMIEYEMQKHLRNAVFTTLSPSSNEKIRDKLGQSLGLTNSMNQRQ